MQIETAQVIMREKIVISYATPWHNQSGSVLWCIPPYTLCQFGLYTELHTKMAQAQHGQVLHIWWSIVPMSLASTRGSSRNVDIRLHHHPYANLLLGGRVESELRDYQFRFQAKDELGCSLSPQSRTEYRIDPLTGGPYEAEVVAPQHMGGCPPTPWQVGPSQERRN